MRYYRDDKTFRTFGEWIEGNEISISRLEGTERICTWYKRKIRFNKSDGLYFLLDNRKYFEYEFDPCD